MDSSDCVIIAHRGASGYLGEHNLASKALAYCQGCDFLEQDIVLTRDGIAVVLHDLHLDDVSNVADHFPSRHRSDGHYYVIDFAYDELRALRFFERRAPMTGSAFYRDRFPTEYNIFRITTLRDEIALTLGLNRTLGRRVGIYPEIKHPKFHRDAGFDLSSIIVDIVRDYDLDLAIGDSPLPIYIQCFNPEELYILRHDLGFRGGLIQLIGDCSWGTHIEGEDSFSSINYDHLKSSGGLQALSEFCDGIGVWHDDLVDICPFSGSVMSSGLSECAQFYHLCVHSYTHRIDDLPPWSTSMSAHLNDLYRLCFLDGIFTDFPDIAFHWRKEFISSH